MSMQVLLADRTDEYKIIGKIKNIKKNSIEIINGEKSRVFNLIKITKIHFEQRDIQLKDLKKADIVEITFWHDGEMKGRNNIATLINVIKRK